MTQTIKVQIKNVYGNETIYPACEKAQALASIANQKTLTRHTLKQAQNLGFAIIILDHFGQPSCELRVA